MAAVRGMTDKTKSALVPVGIVDTVDDAAVPDVEEELLALLVVAAAVVKELVVAADDDEAELLALLVVAAAVVDEVVVPLLGVVRTKLVAPVRVLAAPSLLCP